MLDKKKIKAEIKTKKLRKVRFIEFRNLVIDVARLTVEQKEENSETYTEIAGRLLIPVSDAKKFNTSKSSIKRLFRSMDLTPLLKNGTPKRNNSRKRTFFDLYEYLDLDMNNV